MNKYKNKTIGIPICTRNNLDYLKLCLESLKKNTVEDYNIYLFLDACTDGTQEWLKTINHKEYHIQAIEENKGPKRLGLTNATNKNMKMVKEDIFILGHSDMYFGPRWDIAFKSSIKSKRMTCLTRIEPPIFPPELCKISEPLGNFPNEFDEKGFLKLHKYLIHKGKNKLTFGQFAPYGGLTKEWLKYKVDGNISKQSNEESDLYYKLLIDGFELRQTWQGYVYHFGGRGDRFKTRDLTKFDSDWQNTNTQSLRNFIRKWNSPPRLNKWSFPELPNLDLKDKPIGISCCILAKNEEKQIYKFLEYIEPFFDDIVIVDDKSTDGTREEIGRYIQTTLEQQDEDGKPLNYYFNKDKIKIFTRNLRKDFSKQKNFAISKTKNKWIMHLDVDELPDVDLLYNLQGYITHLEGNNLKVIGFPRKNFIDGKQTQVYPDHQFRFHRRDIEWTGKVHERPKLTNDNFVIVNNHINHIKTLEQHNKRNKFYNKIRAGAGNLIKENDNKTN